MDQYYFVWIMWLVVGIPLLWLATLLLSGILMRNIAARTRLVLQPPVPARPDLSAKQRANWDRVYRQWWARDRAAHGDGARMYLGGENPNQ